MTIKRWKTRLAAGLVTAIALTAPSIGHAGPAGSSLCGEGQHEGGSGPGGDGGSNDLCAQGPAGCVGIGAWIHVEPNIALPTGATIELARSQANAFSGAQSWNGYAYGYGYGHGDAHTAQAVIPGALGTGVVESRCDAQAFSADQQGNFNYAVGQADTSRFSISLANYGMPVYLAGDVLTEDGSSYAGSGSNSASIENLSGSVFGNPIGPINNAAAPNTVYSFGPATLYLNEQSVTPPSPFNP